MMFGWLQFCGQVLLSSGCSGGAPGAARSHLSHSYLSDLEDLGFQSYLMTQNRRTLAATSPGASWCQLCTWKHTHTHTQVEMLIWGCLIDPPEGCKAQPCPGDTVNHLGKEEPGPERCRMSQTLCRGTGKSEQKAGVSMTQINCREGALMEEGEVTYTG